MIHRYFRCDICKKWFSATGERAKFHRAFCLDVPPQLTTLSSTVSSDLLTHRETLDS